MKNIFFLIIFLRIAFNANSQVSPIFGREIPVTINGLTFDAMEPFISPNGSMLFFNSLNDGVNTSLYYATKVNDSIFTYAGEVSGVNLPSPHLDAVASIDSANNFVWVSTRNYPTVFENLQRGTYVAGNVINKTKVYGNFYIYTPGWLIMDAAINYNGNTLYYCNAYFNGCAGGLPCQAKLGIAQKINDSTFNKTAASDAILANINDPNYLVYAPQITKDGLELYFTRILNTGFVTEICVSVRSSTTAVFGAPTVIYTNQPQTPEAATITADKSTIYYHKKPTTLYKIFMRYRLVGSGLPDEIKYNIVSIFPNPACDQLFVCLQNKKLTPIELKIFNVKGQEVLKQKITDSEKTPITISQLSKGCYFVEVTASGQLICSKKLIITR